ncbi:hypothetical protein RUM43_011336 [Polyplax serrata]|uniref:Uncharacterized protein n=1 Tax=Polyplax serrata TaxID=468196 RepID=A0AAN8RTI3_POLSC
MSDWMGNPLGAGNGPTLKRPMMTRRLSGRLDYPFAGQWSMAGKTPMRRFPRENGLSSWTV